MPPAEAHRHAVRRLVVALTDACNLDCAYCFQVRKGSRRLPWEALRAGLDLLLASGPGQGHVSFTGGEPLLDFPAIVRAVDYVEAHRPADLRVEFDVATNGTRLGDEQVAFLVDHDVALDLSFDGVPAAQALRGPATFPTLDHLVERLRRERPDWFARRVRVAITLCRTNLPSLADSVDYFLERGVAAIDLSPALTGDDGWTPADTRQLDRQFARIHRSAVRHFRRAGRVPFLLFRKPALGARPPRTPTGSMCRVGRSGSIALDPSGRAYPCLLFADIYRRPGTPLLETVSEWLALGGVTDATLARRLATLPRVVSRIPLLHGKSRKSSRASRCATCAYLDRCLVCPVAGALMPGNRDPDRIPDFQCAFAQVSLKYQDRFLGQPLVKSLIDQVERAAAGGRHGRVPPRARPPAMRP